jgi:hypothetical protein
MGFEARKATLRNGRRLGKAHAKNAAAVEILK